MRRIAVVTGSRAEYGLIRSTLRAIDNHPDLELKLLVCGMHLDKEYGKTIDQIKQDGFKIWGECKTTNNPTRDIGLLIWWLTDWCQIHKPDILISLTDLNHALATAIVGNYMNIPVTHIHGGDVSGHVDDNIRHAITKLSHIHFPATKESAKRIEKMGEDPKRIFCFGAPGLDDIKSMKLSTKSELYKKYNLNPNKELILVVYHPCQEDLEFQDTEIELINELLLHFDQNNIIIGPNNDEGNKNILKMIPSYMNLPRKDYLSILKHCKLAIGNSSSFVIEAPFFNTPVFMIGNRQAGREIGNNDFGLNVGKEISNILATIDLDEIKTKEMTY
jgi:UDP-N-acetylglucosamine 2-epimerase (non-hydrolysing)/GDP/UDP-N,N'-diacetylbacillosamine 2-epimerase (hydrolysing)